MKPPTRAPFYAAMYHGLCETARKHGYALAIHGTVTADLDLVACPWTEEAVSADELRNALMEHINACDYEQSLVRFGLTPEEARQIASRSAFDRAEKPHGRIAWNLYLDNGCKVDLSVMPRANAVGSVIRPTNVSAECCNELRAAGKPTPRTCGVCGLGPCTKGNP